MVANGPSVNNQGRVVGRARVERRSRASREGIGESVELVVREGVESMASREGRGSR